MLKLIGFIVVMAVLFIGYPAFNSWYAGYSTPKETVEDVRNRVGTALITDGKQNVKSEKPAEASTASSAKDDDSRDPTSADQMLKKMMKE
jgi:hypothetical protein